MFDKIFNALPYPIASGIVRAVRTAIGIVLAGVVTSVADGSLLGVVHVVPAEYAPMVTAALGTFLVGVDKWLRERNLLEDAKAAGLVHPDAKEVPISIVPEDTEDQV